MMLGKPVPSTQNGLNKKCSLNLITFGAGFLDRWCLRAKFDIMNPDSKIHKNKDGDFLNGLEGFKSK